MVFSPCMREQSVKGMLAWREESGMAATANFYQLVVAHAGYSNFAEWAEISDGNGDMSHFMRNKKMSDVERLSDLVGFDTVEKRVRFLEDNFTAFISFAKERYCPYVVTLDQMDAMVSLSDRVPEYTATLDSVIVSAITNMSMAYRHFVFHFFNGDGSSSHTDAKGNPIRLNGEPLEDTKD